MERTFDVLISLAALILLLPLMLLISVLLRLTGEGEVFYLQERVGRNGKLFKLVKFATMLKNSPTLGSGTVTLKNDFRVLRVGKILRKTKINELPQLFNVVAGQMSIVGPRPQTERCFNVFPEDFQKVLIESLPGLSGLGSIVFRNEEELLDDHPGSTRYYDEVIAPYKAQVEVWYLQRRSFHTYCLVILLTVWVVIFPSSTAVWRVFKDIPTPPDDLKSHLFFQ